MSLRRLTAADARRLPWKNGRGVTEELILWPPGASFERGDFDWRLARAAVEQAGPFSAFAGFERVLVVVSGAGLRLAHGDAAPPARLEPLRPYAFRGEWPTTAELLDGPVADLNVLARRGRVAARLDVLRPGAGVELAAGPGHCVVHVLDGTARVRAAGTTHELAPRESLWLRDSAESLLVSGEADVAVLHIDAAV